jgi:hypothetical protein
MALISGIDDYAVARNFGLKRPAVQRHRVNHLMRAAQDRLAILAKGAEAREERQQLAEAATSSDEPPIEAQLEAIVGTRALLNQYNEVQGSLGRSRTQAEEAGAYTAVAAISGQQFRGMEFGAKLAGNRNFLPASTAPQANTQGVWSINMVFENAGKSETINVLKTVVDGDVSDPNAVGENPPAPQANQRIRHDNEGKTLGEYWDFTTPSRHKPRNANTGDDRED